MKKTPYKDVVRLFTNRGCKLLTSEEEYNKGPGINRWKVEYIASCGHTHKMSVFTFINGHGTKCPKCAKSAKAPSEHELASICEKVGCRFVRLVSFVDRSNSKIEIVSSCGHKKITSFKLIRIAKANRKKIVCDKCAITRKKTFEEVKSLFESNGCRLLSEEYHGKDEKLQYIASCGHRHSISYHNFASGWGTICPSCAASRSAALVGQLLDESFSGVVREYQCRPTRLKFDFYIPSKRVAIEYDGKQHFEPVSKFGGTIGHAECKSRDKRKEQWCNANGVRLIRIDGRKWNYKTMDEAFKNWLTEEVNEEKG